eukprot:GHVL01018959.1.p1 GENE.GHVL01018959.1~~GHVL01018959.1.p1  ORF type:complete len:876 (+),score=110.33 GHVL01018959.1:1494-4121(+)
MSKDTDDIGLIICTPNSEQKRVPLVSVQADVIVYDLICKATIHQIYKSQHHEPVEAIYCFPLFERCAVTGFVAEHNGQKTVATIKDVHEAREAYQSAKAQGYGAYLAEQKRPDIWQMKVGNILPNSQITIHLTFVHELSAHSSTIRYVLPLHVGSRYTPAHCGEELYKPGSHDATFTAHVQVNMSHNMSSVTSPSHRLSLTDNNGQTCDTEKNRQIELPEKCNFIEATLSLPEMMKTDFVLKINLDELYTPKALWERFQPEVDDTSSKQSESPYSDCIMLSMVPNMAVKEQQVEMVFVIDRSGSMRGTRIEKSIQAALILLKSLPIGSYFNIVSFGNQFTCFKERSVAYTENSLDEAVAHLKSMTANLGGTEILAPLKHIFDEMIEVTDHNRQIILITDGQVMNEESVIDLVRQHCCDSQVRVFVLGIGSGVSNHLIVGMSRAGNGYAEFALEDEQVKSSIMSLLKKALQPSVDKIKITWSDESEPKNEGPLSFFNPETIQSVVEKKTCLAPQAHPVHQSPWLCPPLFTDSHFLAFGFFNSKTFCPKSVTVTGRAPEGDIKYTLSLNILTQKPGMMVHQLGARAMLRDLEEGTSYLHTEYKSEQQQNEVKTEGVTLGRAFNLASKWTSFVAIEHRPGSEPLVLLDNHCPSDDVADGCNSNFGCSKSGQSRLVGGSGIPNLKKNLSSSRCRNHPSPPAEYHLLSEVNISSASDMMMSAPIPAANQNQVSSASVMMMSAPIPPNQVQKKIIHQTVELAKEPKQKSKRDPGSNDDIVTKILELERFDGSFDLSTDLENLLSIPSDILEQLVKETGCDKRVLACIVVIVIFESKFCDEKNLWELALDKTDKYIETYLKREETSRVKKIVKTVVEKNERC